MKKSKKKKQILELKNTMTELNNSIEGFKRRLDHALIESVTQKTGHLKLPSQRNRKEKRKTMKKA